VINVEEKKFYGEIKDIQFDDFKTILSFRCCTAANIEEVKQCEHFIPSGNNGSCINFICDFINPKKHAKWINFCLYNERGVETKK